MKPCTKCDQLWNEDAFRDGGSVCPDCIRKRSLAWYHANKERIKQHRADYNNAYFHANSTSALANAPTRAMCAVCGITKGKKSFAVGSAICRRCKNA